MEHLTALWALLAANKEWLFSGAGVAIISVFVWFLRRMLRRTHPERRMLKTLNSSAFHIPSAERTRDNSPVGGNTCCVSR